MEENPSWASCLTVGVVGAPFCMFLYSTSWRRGAIAKGLKPLLHYAKSLLEKQDVEEWAHFS
jgi:hypothetical protein